MVSGRLPGVCHECFVVFGIQRNCDYQFAFPIDSSCEKLQNVFFIGAVALPVLEILLIFSFSGCHVQRRTKPFFSKINDCHVHSEGP